MARFYTFVLMLVAMLYSAMAFPHGGYNTTSLATTAPASPPYPVNITGGEQTSGYAVVHSNATNATALPTKRALRNFPIALRVPGRE